MKGAPGGVTFHPTIAIPTFVQQYIQNQAFETFDEFRRALVFKLEEAQHYPDHTPEFAIWIAQVQNAIGAFRNVSELDALVRNIRMATQEYNNPEGAPISEEYAVNWFKAAYDYTQDELSSRTPKNFKNPWDQQYWNRILLAKSTDEIKRIVEEHNSKKNGITTRFHDPYMSFMTALHGALGLEYENTKENVDDWTQLMMAGVARYAVQMAVLQLRGATRTNADAVMINRFHALYPFLLEIAVSYGVMQQIRNGTVAHYSNAGVTMRMVRLLAFRRLTQSTRFWNNARIGKQFVRCVDE